LEVLREVAEAARPRDRLDGFGAARAFELRELRLELSLLRGGQVLDLVVGHRGSLATTAALPFRAPERFQPAPVELRGTRTEVGAEGSGEPSLERVLLARLDRFRRLVVQRRGDGCRPALLTESSDANGPSRRADRDLDGVADTNVLRRLHTCAVHVHSSAEHGLRGGATRLEETRGPQPLVDPDGIHALYFSGRTRTGRDVTASVRAGFVAVTRQASSVPASRRRMGYVRCVAPRTFMPLRRHWYA